MNTADKTILDVTCGARSIWFDKSDNRASLTPAGEQALKDNTQQD